MNEKTKKIAIGAIVLFLIFCAFIAIRSFVGLSLSKTTGSGVFSSTPLADYDSIGLSNSRSDVLWERVEVESSSQNASSKLMQDNSVEAVSNDVNRQYAEGNLTSKKIIKNASLIIYVKDAEKTAAEIKSLVNGLGGFVSNSNIYEKASGEKTGRVIIRVPAENFEEVLNNTKQLAEEVEKEEISAQDVTEQYVDMEAQLLNLRAQEIQYLKILEKSYAIKDILDVTQYLNSVRSQIERIQGQLQYLARQVEMSTISIDLKADADVEVFGLRWRPLTVAKRALRDMFSGLSSYADKMINFLFQLPVIALWFITIIFGIWIAWKILWWLKRFFVLKNK